MTLEVVLLRMKNLASIFEQQWRQSIWSRRLMHFWKIHHPGHIRIKCKAWINQRRLTRNQNQKAHCVHGPNKLLPKLFCRTRLPMLMRVDNLAVEFSSHMTFACIPWSGIPNQSVREAITDDCRQTKLFHTPCEYLFITISDHFSRFSSVIVSMFHTSHCMLNLEDGRTSIYSSFIVKPTSYFWDLHDKENCVAFSVQCETSSNWSECSLWLWASCWDDDRFESSDQNCDWW